MSHGTVETGCRPAAELQSWARDLLDPALYAAVDSLSPRVRRTAGYHLGWWDEHGRHPTGTGGKALRPTLALLAAEAVGFAAPAAVPAAVAVELVHNFSLLHDDVLDRDAVRRHRPAAWVVFGTGAAILAGDALLTLAFDVLASSGHPASAEGVRRLSATVQDLISGQDTDVGLERRSDAALDECLRMAAEKTGALFACAAAMGAVFAGASSAREEALRAFGVHMGVAFQVVDDMLGIWGDPALTGKPRYSDLQSRKKSIPVVAALTAGTAAARELAAVYCGNGKEPRPASELPLIAEMVEEAGGRAWSRTKAAALLADALDDLAAVDLLEPAATDLLTLATLAVHRDY
jgi:geranylgeranyl diphosphate synthase type I